MTSPIEKGAEMEAKYTDVTAAEKIARLFAERAMRSGHGWALDPKYIITLCDAVRLTATRESKTESSPEVTEAMVERAAVAFLDRIDTDVYVGGCSDLNSVLIDGCVDVAASMRDALTALSVGREGAAQGRDAVRVKPLVWKKGAKTDWAGNQFWRANTTFDWAYRIYFEGGSYVFRERGSDFDTLEAAKAAAQADYTACILSALATPEAGTSEPVAWTSSDFKDRLARNNCALMIEDRGAPLANYTVPVYVGHPAPAQAPVDGEAVRALREAGCTSDDGSMVIAPTTKVVAALAAPSARKEK